MAYKLEEFDETEISVALTGRHDAILGKHLHKPNRQEDLAFAYWRPSKGQCRFTIIITELILPEEGDRILQGNVVFNPQYLDRVLAEVPDGSGIAFIHGHLSPGWQGMSDDDVVAEGERLAGPVAGRTGMPLIGLTRGTDGAWSGRLWFRTAPRIYEQQKARSVRVVGSRVAITYHPSEPPVQATDSQEATLSVWGAKAQEGLVRTRVGIVGLGSVGSIVAEELSRLGLNDLVYIDFDKIEPRNLDRTMGASYDEVGQLKVQVAASNSRHSSTALNLTLKEIPYSLLTPEGLSAALDCDVLVCCVDRPWPKHLLNTVAYSHLIPVIDGGIFASVKQDGTPQHIAWRIHTVGPNRACLVCLNALRRSDVALDIDGKLDDPDYIAGLSEEDKAAFSRRNVFPFSLSVAAHEVLQLVRLLTGFSRVGGRGPQIYNGYPGTMDVLEIRECDADCEFAELTATAVDLTPNLAKSACNGSPS